MTRQLTLDGGEVAPAGKTRHAGLLGKVQAAIEEHPWCTPAEIAKAIGEKAPAVGSALYALKKEGSAQPEYGLGARGGSVWASTSETGRETRQRALQARQYEQACKRGLLPAPPDWRPNETIPEDYYAL